MGEALLGVLILKTPNRMNSLSLRERARVREP
jgi:hypothetical protein